MTYIVSTIARDANDMIVSAEVGRFTTKAKAMSAAKKAARTRSDCRSYGPSSLAYYGRDITAVVAW